MKLHIILGGAVAACATNANAAGIPDLKSVVASLDGEYLTYSGSRGTRFTVDARTRAGLGDTKVEFLVSQGYRKTDESKVHATRAQGTLVHDWSSTISTRTTAGIATGGSVFVNRELVQEVNFRVAPGTLLTAGGRYARYDQGVDVRSWSLGAAQYFRGGYLSYRFTSYDIDRLGNSVGHVVGAKFADPYGANQFWLGRGNAIHDAEWLATPEKGKYTQVEYRRLQPIGAGVSLSLGVKRNWYDTPSAKFHGLGFRFGLTFDANAAGARRRLPAADPEDASEDEAKAPKVASAR